MDLKKVFEHNRTWASQKIAGDEHYFDKLASGQAPKLLYIGCADSRVTAEAILGAEPGDVFVHRNVANLVPAGDHNARSVINYAVDHLHVEDIVVCGHYGCGGVKAAMGNDDLGVLNPWIDHIRAVYEQGRDVLEAIEDEGDRYRKFVELNVAQQCQNLAELEEIKIKMASDSIKIHGWVFDMETGRLGDLGADI